ncbi:MAG: 2Fe-2S iron-sulfur cluster-binding protein [Acidimicrobiales bacterium]|nr:2Fe-2S iron-sulfur cluster-binding protein [Acidimicrobiales bacterium]
MTDGFTLRVDGREVGVADEHATLLDVLRDVAGVRSVKDGCSPQGQCGCCTVLVDGQPRVSCVTPVRRVRDREITTVDGLPAGVSAAWGDAFAATGGSQCGFCTPGIICRYEGLRAKGVDHEDRAAAEKSLQAHLCRCTGWQPVVDAWVAFPTAAAGEPTDAARARAELEGGVPQSVGPLVALGQGGFADDMAPAGALVAVPMAEGDGWAVADTRAEALAAAGKIQGRRTTAESPPPIELPAGDWDRTLRTSWVEPAYLETDAAWCEPGGEAASPLANGGAFGAKAASEVGAVARRLADEHGRAVRVLYSREDAVRRGAKRPPIAAGVAADGRGVVRVARTDGVADAIRSVAPDFEVEEVDVPGPPTSVDIRGAGWVEAAVLLDSLRDGGGWIQAPGGGAAMAAVGDDGAITVTVRPGAVLDETVLRSYCTGAAHMALGWVTSERLTVDEAGEIHDLTIRSFGVLRAIDTPRIDVVIEETDAPAVAVSDAAFAAVASAVWRSLDFPPTWPAP